MFIKALRKWMEKQCYIQTEICEHGVFIVSTITFIPTMFNEDLLINGPKSKVTVNKNRQKNKYKTKTDR